MLFESRLEAVVDVVEEHLFHGRTAWEGRLASEDGQVIYIYEGQLKEVATGVEVGKRYRVTFRPFVNNRWIEVKISALIEEPGAG